MNFLNLLKERFFGIKISFGDGKKPELEATTWSIESEENQNKRRQLK